MKKASLLPDVAEVFTLKHVKPGRHQVNGFGEIDFTSITLVEAEALHKLGMPLLVRKAKKVK